MHHRHRDQAMFDDRHEVVELLAAFDHDTDVVAGAAHIGSDDIAKAGLLGQMLGCRNAGDGTGVHRLQRIGGVELGHAAGVVHHQHRLAVARGAQVQLQRRHAEVHDLVQEGIHDGGTGADVFTLAARDLVREQHRHRAQHVLGIVFEKDALDRQFVRGIDHPVGQRHDDGLGAFIEQVANLEPDILFIERHQNFAGVVDAFAHVADHLDRHQRHRAPRVGQIALVGDRMPFAIGPTATDGHHAAETGRGEQADLGPLELDQRVGAERGGVTHRVDRRQQFGALDADLGTGSIERLVKTQRQVMFGGQRLGFNVVVVPDHETVGEGAADIYGYSFHLVLSRIQ